jgi:hypothetical protein
MQKARELRFSELLQRKAEEMSQKFGIPFTAEELKYCLFIPFNEIII